jgi:hypothetical protein
MKKNLIKFYLLVLIVIGLLDQAHAQLTISGHLRTRTELRDGQGTLSVKDTVPAFFTSQRTRLNVGFSSHRLKLHTSVQDVRVWGQEASTVNRVTPDNFDGLMLHEAWAEISLVDTGKVVRNLTLKIGRQELIYDDVRLLGNLDWLQQARRHDAVLIKLDHHGWTAHLGAAFNQNAERKSNTIYNGVPTGYGAGTNGMLSMYKSLQFVYVAKKFPFGNVSLLSLKDDFSKYHFAETDVAMTTPIYDRGVWSRLTSGVNISGSAMKRLTFAGTLFYQSGQYREGTTLDEYLVSASAAYAFSGKLSIGPGVDFTTGNNGSDPTKKFQRFDPLYGTPHKFWGYMDYFYVADGFGSNGLVNVYLKTKYKPVESLTLLLDFHQFSVPNAIIDESGNRLNKSLAQEFDFVFNYSLTKQVTIEGGYCTLFGTSTLSSAKVKNIRDPDLSASWAYLMISIKPEVVFKNQIPF